MGETKKKFSKEAEEFFADEKNSNVNKIYITSDGWVFRAHHYATNWVKDNPKLTIEAHYRALAPKAEILSGEDDEDKDPNNLDTASLELTGRAKLVKEYIELFDTKPHHMFSDEKVQSLIDAEKARLKAEEDAANEDGKHVVTEEDLQNNPVLVEQGVQVGDKIDLPTE